MIKLHSIILKNFKRHEEFSARFTDGVNLVCGANYSGKSTLLHGVLFALFGARAVPCGADDLVRRGAKQMRVTLILHDAGGGHYTLTRTKSNAEIVRGEADGSNKVEAVGHSAVNSKVEEILGLSYKRFTELRYAEQKKTETMLTLGATQLHSLLEELSGANTVNAAIKKCSEIQTEQNAVLQALGDIAGKDIPALTAQRANLADQLAAAEDPDTLLEAVSVADIARNKARAALDDAREHNRKYREADSAWRDAAALRNAAGDKHSAAQYTHDAAASDGMTGVDSKALRAAAAKLRAEVDGWQARADAHERWHHKAGNMAAEGDRLADVAGAADTAMDVAREAYEAAGGNDLVHVLGNQRRQYEADIAALRADRAALKQKIESGVCTSCQRPFDNAAEHMAHWQEELETVRTRGQAAADALTRTLANIESLETLKAAMTRASEAYTVASNAHQRHKAAYDAHMAAQPAEPGPKPDESLEADAAALEAKADAADAARLRLVRAKDALDAAAAALAERQAAFSAAATKVSELAGLREEPVEAAQAAEVAHADALARHRGAEAATTGLRAQIAGIDREVENEARIAGKRTEAQRRRDVAKELWSYLRDNRDRFMGQVWGSIMASATAFVASCTGGDIERVYRDGDGEFRYVEKGEEFSARGSASGAQRSLMGLGVQIAMSQLTRCPLGVLLMDEPSADMDAKVSAAMTGLLSTLGLQVVMVSHREMDASLAANLIVTEEAA